MPEWWVAFLLGGTASAVLALGILLVLVGIHNLRQ